jgi:hypothetical protein
MPSKVARSIESDELRWKACVRVSVCLCLSPAEKGSIRLGELCQAYWVNTPSIFRSPHPPLYASIDFCVFWANVSFFRSATVRRSVKVASKNKAESDAVEPADWTAMENKGAAL